MDFDEGREGHGTAAAHKKDQNTKQIKHIVCAYVDVLKGLLGAALGIQQCWHWAIETPN